MENLIELFRKLLGMPVLASEHGHKVDDVIVYVHWLMIALFVGWLAYFVYCLFRFRAGRNPKADYTGVKGHASTYLEIAVAVIEGVILIGFAMPFWAQMADAAKFPKAEESIVINVVAQQFQWNVRYSGLDGVFGRQDFALVDAAKNPFGLDPDDPAGKDDFSSDNQIHCMTNKPVIINLTSKDVIHSFKVIAFRTTQDAIPGLKIPLHFTPTKLGTYQINCAQLCGNGHAAMAMGRVIVDTKEDYEKWLAGKSKSAAGATQSFE
jgi:cytochrome c oxidase subunit 2